MDEFRCMNPKRSFFDLCGRPAIIVSLYNTPTCEKCMSFEGILVTLYARSIGLENWRKELYDTD